MGLSLAALMWATVRFDPARVGILMQTKVEVGAVTSAPLAGERMHSLEIAGACAGGLGGAVRGLAGAPPSRGQRVTG
ncbi:hypothetical protein CSE45_1341 [Citreicella sp. SE45]|nr:hypothetical protein CSE45_1341 [Citreicella sp. SE45]